LFCTLINQADLISKTILSEFVHLSLPHDAVFEAGAQEGDGVFDTLKAVSQQFLTELRKS
jgi:hypothetical protein